MAALIRRVERDHHEMPDPRAHDVVAARASVLLLATDVADVVAA
jgi:hypothetical protein